MIRRDVPYTYRMICSITPRSAKSPNTELHEPARPNARQRSRSRGTAHAGHGVCAVHDRTHGHPCKSMMASWTDTRTPPSSLASARMAAPTPHPMPHIAHTCAPRPSARDFARAAGQLCGPSAENAPTRPVSLGPPALLYQYIAALRCSTRTGECRSACRPHVSAGVRDTGMQQGQARWKSAKRMATRSMSTYSASGMPMADAGK